MRHEAVYQADGGGGVHDDGVGQWDGEEEEDDKKEEVHARKHEEDGK